MLVGKIINIIGCMLCIFAARKFAKDGDTCMSLTMEPQMTIRLK